MKKFLLSIALLMSAPVLCQDMPDQSVPVAVENLNNVPAVDSQSMVALVMPPSAQDLLSLSEFQQRFESKLNGFVQQIISELAVERDQEILCNRIRGFLNFYINQCMSMTDVTREKQEALLASFTLEQVSELVRADYSQEELALLASRDSVAAA